MNPVISGWCMKDISIYWFLWKCLSLRCCFPSDVDASLWIDFFSYLKMLVFCDDGKVLLLGRFSGSHSGEMMLLLSFVSKYGTLLRLSSPAFGGTWYLSKGAGGGWRERANSQVILSVVLQPNTHWSPCLLLFVSTIVEQLSTCSHLPINPPLNEFRIWYPPLV